MRHLRDQREMNSRIVVSLSVHPSVRMLNLENLYTDFDCKECRVLGCGVVWVLLGQMFRKNVSPPYSG
jgi:hypothetical protein